MNIFYLIYLVYLKNTIFDFLDGPNAMHLHSGGGKTDRNSTQSTCVLITIRER